MNKFKLYRDVTNTIITDQDKIKIERYSTNKILELNNERIKGVKCYHKKYENFGWVRCKCDCEVNTNDNTLYYNLSKRKEELFDNGLVIINLEKLTQQKILVNSLGINNNPYYNHNNK